jgi:hypothetical protein
MIPARTYDPITSHIAAAGTKNFAPEHRQRILDALKTMPNNEGTFAEIARAAGLTESQVWKRLSELERKDLIIHNSRVKYEPGSRYPRAIWKLARV